MKFRAWMLAGGLAFAGMTAQAQQPVIPQSNLPQATSAVLQGPCPYPCPPSTTNPASPTSPTAPTVPTSQSDDLLAGESGSKGIASVGNIVTGGTGLSTAVNAAGSGTFVTTPLILPGLFTAASSQSAVPVDRVFFNYGYFDSFQVANPPSLVNGATVVSNNGTRAGFSLNVFNLGLEKTFLDGWASAYVSVPLLYAADNSSGQNISGLGDVNVGVKLVVLRDSQSGSVVTVGTTVAVPTGHEAVVTSSVANATNTGFVPSTSTTVNPTFIQPWIAGLLVLDRLYVHEYFGVVVPTDDRVATILNNNLTLGYNLYQCRYGFITSVTPMVSAQALIPVTNAGSPSGAGTQNGNNGQFSNQSLVPPPSNFSFPDQLFLSSGVQVGVGQRALFSAAVVTPLVGPTGFSYGLTMGINLLY